MLRKAKYKFEIGELVIHKDLNEIWGEVVDRGFNPARNYYMIKLYDSVFTARHDEDVLTNDHIILHRMNKLNKLGI